MHSPGEQASTVQGLMMARTCPRPMAPPGPMRLPQWSSIEAPEGSRQPPYFAGPLSQDALATNRPRASAAMAFVSS
jgi:hypothetical protein